MEEIWKTISGYEGLYEVSNLGRIRSFDRICNSKAGSKRLLKGKIIVGGVNSRGYRQNHLRDACGNRTTVAVHRLVLKEFVGEPLKDQQACHNDGNKLNNQLDNLRWDTCKNNQADKIMHGTVAKGEVNGNAKLDKSIVMAIRKEKCARKELALRYGISETNISSIKLRRTWKHV